MVSGGIDSQAMLYSWKLFGRDFIPTSVIYDHDMNLHDLETLSEFAKQENLEINYVNFDLLQFYEKRYHELCERYQCISPHFGAHLGMTEALSGTVIFSGDRLGKFTAVLAKNNMCLVEASKERNIVPFFFMHTPELAYSMIYEMNIGHIRNTAAPGYISKVNEWQSSRFPIIPQVKKYTGFEKIKEHYDEQYGHLVTTKLKLMYSTKTSKRAYDLLLRYPYELKFGNPIYNYYINHAII
jgi:hypothetical protein